MFYSYEDYCSHVCKSRLQGIPSDKKGLVLDFDNTITRVHSSPDTPTEVLMTPFDQKKFQELIDVLIRNNIETYIASYGYKDVILRTMEDVLGDNNIFTDRNVITPSDISPSWREGYEPPEGMNKNNMLDLIKERSGLSQLLLIDDNKPSVFTAIDAGYLAEAAFPNKGMGKNADLILYYLKKHKMIPTLNSNICYR